MVHGIMDRVGCPPGYWLLCILYVIGLLNVLTNSKGFIPLTVVTGYQTDISSYLDYHFWQEVFVEVPGGGEQLAHWCGPSNKQGDFLTYFVLLDDTQQLVTRSNIRTAKDPLFPNRLQRPNPSNGDTSILVTKPVITTIQDHFDNNLELPMFSPDELIGMTVLRNVDEELIRAKVVRKIMDRDAENHSQIKFLLLLGDGQVEEIISYNELSDLVTESMSAKESGIQDFMTYSGILDHQGPLKRHDPRFKGSSYNVLVDWDDGSQTWEPINIIGKQDPVTVARYAHDKGLLNKPGWKFLRRTAKRRRFINVILNSIQRRKNPNQIRYKFRVRVLRTYEEAVMIDKDNGNTLWKDGIRRELDQIFSYQTFCDLGKGGSPGAEYKKIKVCFVFDVKADGKRKGRLVARGDMTPEPDESVYSSVATLWSLRIVAFLAELNGLMLMQGDIGNAYLESYTHEKVYFIAGPEFSHYAGHTFIIDKALYGLRSSGLCFHERLSTVLRSFGYNQSKVDPDVWMRDGGNVWEYAVIYVDDIIVAMKDPKAFFDDLQGPKIAFTMKGVGKPTYHLGADFYRDEDGTLCLGAQTYSKRLCATFESLYGEQPKPAFSPLAHDDHPELDNSPLCGPDDTAKFQSLIGACQWLISLCRFDISHAIMSLSRFRHCPRQGHVDRLKQVCGYIQKFPQGAIRFRTGIPNHESVFSDSPTKHDWMETVYGSPTEEIPPDAPEAKGNSVCTTTYTDANLLHDQVTGRSATGILHFFNRTPIDSFSKRQNQVESATYGSEFMAARQSVDQIIDLQYTLRMFGVPIHGPSWLFGDNKSVVTSSTIPHSSLNKRWNALSYHKVREAVASGFVRFEHISTTDSPADILTKPLPWHKARIHVEPLLFWKGETMTDANADLPLNAPTGGE